MIAKVHGAKAPLRGTVAAPPSKNYTTRYIVASCLARGTSEVIGPAVQDDSIALVRCVSRMGARVEATDRQGRSLPFAIENAAEIRELIIDGFGDKPRLDGKEPLDPGNAGAVLRFLLGVAALMPKARFATTHAESLGKRPNRHLLDALHQLGLVWTASNEEGCLPITTTGGAKRLREHIAGRRTRELLPPGSPIPVRISGSISSQFISALLFAAPLIGEDIEILVEPPLRSRPLVATTRRVLTAAGVRVESSKDQLRHVIRAGQAYRPNRWRVNGDWPGASAILSAAAAVPGSRVSVTGLHADEQGEQRIMDFLRAAGVRHGIGEAVTIETDPERPLNCALIDGDLCTDAVPAMLGAAMVFDGESSFLGIRNLQFKESDRIRRPVEELRKVYATALPAPNGLSASDPEKCIYHDPADDPNSILIKGWPAGFRGGIVVDGHKDHRLIMMLSIVALRCRDGLYIRGAEHVSKSFPGWFDMLRTLGATVEFQEDGE